MKQVSVIGTGNVAFHLVKKLTELSFDIQLFGRNKSALLDFKDKFSCNIIEDLDFLKDDTIVFICVPDSEIKSIVEKLPKKTIKIYTAGSVEMLTISKENVGVFYPLQTFSKNRELNFAEIPILLEASDEKIMNLLLQIASLFSSKVYQMDSNKRKLIHLSAVFINNFTNHLFYLAKQKIEQTDSNWEILFPLLHETIEKAKEIGPYNAQTGPAKRNDLLSLKEHTKMLEKDEQDIYKSITNSILKLYGHEMSINFFKQNIQND